jgi:type VI secretion system protein ImpK
MTMPMQTPGAGAAAPAAGLGASPRRGQLALAMQEALTATVRVRADRQVAADAESFRQHVKQVLAAADQEARRAGYSDEDVRFALYAVVAFLDESVLNSTQRMFAEWPRRPLQDEIFGGHLGGELFFQNVQHMLTRPDSDDLADVLEVYQLCMLLGFHGRYSASESGELGMLMNRVAEKMQRIRGGFGALAPAWALPPGTISSGGRDPWARRLGYAALGAAALAVVLFVVFHFSLGSGASDVQALVLPIAR